MAEEMTLKEAMASVRETLEASPNLDHSIDDLAVRTLLAFCESHTLDISDGQRRALRTLLDGEWHGVNKATRPGVLFPGVATALWRAGLAERCEIDPAERNSGWQYRITSEGRQAYRQAVEY